MGGAVLGLGSSVAVTIQASDGAFGVFQFANSSVNIRGSEDGDGGFNIIVLQVEWSQQIINCWMIVTTTGSTLSIIPLTINDYWKHINAIIRGISMEGNTVAATVRSRKKQASSWMQVELTAVQEHKTFPPGSPWWGGVIKISYSLWSFHLISGAQQSLLQSLSLRNWSFYLFFSTKKSWETLSLVEIFFYNSQF